MSNVDLSNKNVSSLEQQQYVAFMLDDELFGADVMKAQEVLGMTPIDHVPDTMPYMKGVIDLRGKIVPIVNLRIKFGMEEIPYNDETAIIITEMHDEIVGLIVDSVVDVTSISREEIQNTPHFTAKMDKDSVKGIGKVGDKIIILLDVNKILSKEEMIGLTQ